MPKEMRKGEISEPNLEEQGIFPKRFKSHNDSVGIVSDYFRKNKKFGTEAELLERMQKPAENELGTIYVHTPYCDKICSFCNLNRKQIDNDLEDYTSFLVSEFEKYGKTPYMKSKKINVIFFGGGTPTIYKEHQLERILKAINDNFTLTDDCEFTLETTLHNLNQKKIKILEKGGVNRLSVGIQTFSDRGRKILNRTFSKEETVKRLRNLKESFSGMVCTDIIYNYPDETVEEVLEDARIVKELKIDSTSFYSLMIYEGSQMSKDIRNNMLKLNYELKKDFELHDAFLKSMLESQNYEVMEHTKIVRKGRDEYRYIRNTHQGKDILPIGVGAGGKIDNFEIFRLSQDKAFYAISSDENEMKMKRISGLLQYPKVYFDKLKEYVSDEMFNEIYKILENFEKKGYLKIHETHTELTSEGIFWGNNISATILKKCLGGAKDVKSSSLFHINRKHKKNS